MQTSLPMMRLNSVQPGYDNCSEIHTQTRPRFGYIMGGDTWVPNRDDPEHHREQTRRLYHALISQNWQEARLALEAGADWNMQTGDGFNLFHCAAKIGDLDLAKFARQKKAGLNCRSGTTGGKYRNWTPLHVAARYGQKEITEWLLGEQLIDRNAKTSDGLTPIMLAIRYHHWDIVDQLLQARAWVNITSDDENNVITETINSGNYALLKRLLEAGLRPFIMSTIVKQPLFLAVEKEKPEMVELLLDHQANANTTYQKQSVLKQALLPASGFISLRMVSAFVDKGALGNFSMPLPESKNSATQPVLHWVLRRSHFQDWQNIAMQLIKNGLDLNETDTDGNTALMLSAIGGDVHVAQLLLEKGADPFLTNHSGETALTLAGRHGKTNIVRLLSQHLFPVVQYQKTKKNKEKI